MWVALNCVVNCCANNPLSSAVTLSHSKVSISVDPTPTGLLDLLPRDLDGLALGILPSESLTVVGRLSSIVG